MRTANLSYGLLKKCLEEAAGLGYLTLSQEEYGVTEDGDAFLRKYVEYASRYSGVGRELESMKMKKRRVDENVHELQRAFVWSLGDMLCWLWLFRSLFLRFRRAMARWATPELGDSGCSLDGSCWIGVGDCFA
jgi:hypothetical protein